MARTISRKYNTKADHFVEKQYEHIHQMMELTDQSLTQMNKLMIGRKASFPKIAQFVLVSSSKEKRPSLQSDFVT